ncbi:MAG TPA: class I tRNA ligase family protein, partial [Polyangiales bacterium]
LLDKARKSGASEGGLKYIQKTYPEGFIAYGADALRYTLLSYSPQSRRIALSVKRIEGYRNFCNKLWNASRYALGQLEGSDALATGERPVATLLINRWILSRLDNALTTANQGLEAYRLDDSSLALYHFVWNELCDWYLELTKPLLNGGNAEAARETRTVLVHVLETVLRALHPMIPFITEEIWQRVPKREGLAKACIVAHYPAADQGLRDEAAEREMSWLTAVIIAVRTIRAEHDVAPKKPIELYARSDDDARRALLSAQASAIETLCNASLKIEATSAAPIEHAATAVAEGVTVLVPLGGLVDADKERERVTRELAKVEKDLGVLDKKLGNESFIARAPAEVVAKDRERRAELDVAREKLKEALIKLAG